MRFNIFVIDYDSGRKGKDVNRSLTATAISQMDKGLLHPSFWEKVGVDVFLLFHELPPTGNLYILEDDAIGEFHPSCEIGVVADELETLVLIGDPVFVGPQVIVEPVYGAFDRCSVEQILGRYRQPSGADLEIAVGDLAQPGDRENEKDPDNNDDNGEFDEGKTPGVGVLSDTGCQYRVRLTGSKRTAGRFFSVPFRRASIRGRA
jgi:hypothetical protein